MTALYMTDVLKRIYADVQAGVRIEFSTFESFVNHYDIQKSHDTLTTVRVSTELRYCEFDDTLVLSKKLLHALDKSNPCLDLGDIDGKHSNVRRKWLTIRKSVDDNYYSVMKHGDQEEIPGWLDNNMHKIVHPTHVAINLQKHASHIDDYMPCWRLPYNGIVAVPISARKNDPGAEISHEHYIARYAELYYEDGDEESALVMYHADKISARLIELGVPETVTIAMLPDELVHVDYATVEQHLIDANADMAWIAELLTHQVAYTNKRARSHYTRLVAQQPMENTLRRWIVEVVVATDLESFSDNNPFTTRITLEEARTSELAGLPVYLNFNEQHPIGVVLSSDVAYRTWTVKISVAISDFDRARWMQFRHYVLETTRALPGLRQMSYDYGFQLVPAEDVPGMVQRRSWIKSFSFVRVGDHAGSRVVSVREQNQYSTFKYPLLVSSPALTG